VSSAKFMNYNGINRISRRARITAARVDLDRPIDQGLGLIRAAEES
jgi:hypothetical protein